MIDVITELKKPSMGLKNLLGGFSNDSRPATTGDTMKKIGRNFGRFLNRQSTTLNLNLPPEDQYILVLENFFLSETGFFNRFFAGVVRYG